MSGIHLTVYKNNDGIFKYHCFDKRYQADSYRRYKALKKLESYVPIEEVKKCYTLYNCDLSKKFENITGIRLNDFIPIKKYTLEKHEPHEIYKNKMAEKYNN